MNKPTTNKKRYSEVLEQNITIGGKTGSVKCEDGTFYSKKELNYLAYTGMSKQIHGVKKIFDGVVCGVRIR